MASVRRYEHKLATQRRMDERTDALTSYLSTDKMLRENFRSDERVVTQRQNKELRSAARERAMGEALEAATRGKERETMLRDQDERLAAAMAAKKNDTLRESKNLARVYAQSEELRELEAKLKAAVLNKEREAQIVESANLAAEADAHEALAHQVMEEQRQIGLQAEAYREHLRAEDGKAMLAALDDQMREKETTRKQDAYAEFLKEKDMVDKVVAKIIEEDELERAAREAKQLETRKYIDDFMATQEEYKAVRMQEIEAENALIRDYAEKVMAREVAARVAAEREKNSKDAILEKLSAEMKLRQAEADEMENLRNELLLQETEEAIIQKEKEKMQRAVQQRMDVALANEYQRQLKAIKREEEKREEEQFRTVMLEKYAEDDRIDMLNAQKRREKQKEHRKEVERLLDERRERFEAERAKELEEQMDGQRFAEMRRMIIEDERKRMLAAAAKQIGVRHLPKGVLLTEDDAKLFAQ